MAKKYFYGTDGNWATTGNWWNNEGHTVAAGALPATTDDVILLSNVSNLGADRRINSISAVNVNLALPPPPNRTLYCSSSAILFNSSFAVTLSAGAGAYIFGSSTISDYYQYIDQYNSITYSSTLSGNAYCYDTPANYSVYNTPIYGSVYAFNNGSIRYCSVSLSGFFYDNSYASYGSITNVAFFRNNSYTQTNYFNNNCYFYDNSRSYNSTFSKNTYYYNNSLNNSSNTVLTSYLYDGSYEQNSTAGYFYIDTLSSLNTSTTRWYTSSGAKFNGVSSQTLYISGTNTFFLYVDRDPAIYKFVNAFNKPITAAYFSDSAINAYRYDYLGYYGGRGVWTPLSSTVVLAYANFKDQSYNNAIVLSADFYDTSYNNLSCGNASFRNSSYNNVSCINAYFHDNSYNTFIVSGSAIYISALKQNLNISSPWVPNRFENIILDSTYKPITSLNIINSYNAGTPPFNVIIFTNSYNTSTLSSKTSAVYFQGKSYNTGTLNSVTTAYFNDFSYNGSGGTYSTAIINSIKKGVNGTSLMM